MKSYKKVVNERYDKDSNESHIYNNQYSLINPVGLYGRMRLQKIFHIIFNRLRRLDVDISSLKILDIGCGGGYWTRNFAEITESPAGIEGMDLSPHRIHVATKMNPGINYFLGDIVDLNPSEQSKFNFISAIDIFMFLNSEDEIKSALRNVNSLLVNKGVFVWYELYNKDHFSVVKNQEDAGYKGYKPQQIEAFAKEAGFSKLFSISVFKNIFWKYHSMYLVKKFPFWMVSLLEKCCLGSPGNLCYVFEKK